MKSFYSRLSYSFGNEGWETEQKALKMEPHNRVLCITASGDRPLHLLMNPCQEIVSIDTNPIQNHLLNLKKVAMHELEFPEYLSFIGITDHPNRLVCFKMFEHLMNPISRLYWQQNSQAIAKGVIFQGAVEKWLSQTSILLRLLRGKKVKQLFSFNDLEKQKEFVEKKWNTFLWRKMFALSLNPLVTRFIIKDPGLYAYVDPSMSPSSYIYERLNGALSRFLAKENAMLSMLFSGNIANEALPPYLCDQGVQTIKKQLDKLSSHTTDVASYLKTAPDNSFDRFSLSDIVSYMSPKDFEHVMDELKRVAKNGTRFCIRQFLSKRDIPEHLQEHFQREPELEKQLEQEDSCSYYNFMVGTINK